MATPRKRYFRVADSVLFENWDDNQLATMVRLCAYLNVRWAREGRDLAEACGADLSTADLFKITGKNRVDVALKSLQRLAEVTSMSAERCGDVTRVRWPKFAIFQEFPSPSASASAASPASAYEEKRVEREKAPAAPAAPRPTRQRSSTPKTSCPDHLEPAQRDAIRAWASENGIDHATLRPEWDAMRDHWRGLDERRADWPATFRTWLRRSQRFKTRDDQQNNRESAAQARERRTKEAAREAFRQMTEGQPSLLALPGGRI